MSKRSDRVYDRAYGRTADGETEEYRGKWVSDRPGPSHTGVWVILKAGELVGKILVSYPEDGAGNLYADLYDWTTDREPVGGSAVWHGRGTGYGHDKLAAALTGARFGPEQIELGQDWESALRNAGYLPWRLL